MSSLSKLRVLLLDTPGADSVRYRLLVAPARAGATRDSDRRHGLTGARISSWATGSVAVR